MLATFVFPIFDGRLLLDNGPSRTDQPSWSPALSGQYVRGFGGMDQKLRGDDLAEADFCKARMALNFGQIAPFHLPVERRVNFQSTKIWVRGAPNRASRRLYFDGHLTARFEVTFELPMRREMFPGINRVQYDELIVENDLVAPLIGHLCKLPVTIAPGHAHARTISLIDAGPALAQHFALATVSRRKLKSDSIHSAGKVCRAGRPLIILRLLHEGAVSKFPQSAIFAEFGDRVLDSWTFRSPNLSVPLLVFRDRSRCNELTREPSTARNMRFFLARLHATAECVALTRACPAAWAGMVRLVHLERTLSTLDKLVERLRRGAADLETLAAVMARERLTWLESARDLLDEFAELREAEADRIAELREAEADRIAELWEAEADRRWGPRGTVAEPAVDAPLRHGGHRTLRESLGDLRKSLGDKEHQKLPAEVMRQLEGEEASDTLRVRGEDKLRLEASTRMIATIRQLWGDPASALFNQIRQGEEGVRIRHQLLRQSHDVFISYRRDESDFARLIYNHLTERFGHDGIFFDRDRLRPGADFPEELARAVGATRVLVAIIGSNWLGRRSNRAMRIDEPEDWVRREIELALNHNKKIIPVLRLRNSFPKDLPRAIARLRDFNAIVVDSKGAFEYHMTRLIDEIRQGD